MQLLNSATSTTVQYLLAIAFAAKVTKGQSPNRPKLTREFYVHLPRRADGGTGMSLLDGLVRCYFTRIGDRTAMVVDHGRAEVAENGLTVCLNKSEILAVAHKLTEGSPHGN